MSHTPGPWAWFGNTQNKDISLATTYGGRKFVMGFARWGMTGAQPRFRVDGVMRPASELVTFEVEYRKDIATIGHHDAILIATAPELLEKLQLIYAGMACSCRLQPLVGGPVPCPTCQIGALVAKAEGKAFEPRERDRAVQS